MSLINKSDNKLTEDEQSALIEYSDAVQQAHEKITVTTNKRTLWAVWQNYVIIGLLALMYFGNNENARLNAENDRLFRKNHQHAETREAILGFIFNSPNKLERATKMNLLRPNGFPFDEWNPKMLKNLIQVALDARQRKALQWVTEQPNWQSVLDEDTVIAVQEMVAKKHEGVNRGTLSAKQRLERAAKKSYELMVDEFERELAKLEIKEEGSSLQNSQGN
tara:strand:- start:2805 stop:3467 length:663 start_codon:yes stop_codon:yes gene_type:complete